MWVARDNDGCLCLFWDKPIRDERAKQWVLNEGSTEVNYLREEDCQFKISWEDEPMEVGLVPTMLNATQRKTAEAVGEYFDYVGHIQDIHPYDKKRTGFV